MSLLLAIALQAATAAPKAAPPSVPQRFSVLAPVPDEPCVRHPGDDLVVCAAPLKEQRLPLPDEAVPDGPVPSNTFVTGSGALAAEGVPCAATQKGCLVGFGPPIAPIAAAAVSAIKSAFAKKPDKRGRVSIPLDDPAP